MTAAAGWALLIVGALGLYASLSATLGDGRPGRALRSAVGALTGPASPETFAAKLEVYRSDGFVRAGCLFLPSIAILLSLPEVMMDRELRAQWDGLGRHAFLAGMLAGCLVAGLALRGLCGLIWRIGPWRRVVLAVHRFFLGGARASSTLARVVLLHSTSVFVAVAYGIAVESGAAAESTTNLWLDLAIAAAWVVAAPALGTLSLAAGMTLFRAFGALAVTAGRRVARVHARRAAASWGSAAAAAASGWFLAFGVG